MIIIILIADIYLLAYSDAYKKGIVHKSVQSISIAGQAMVIAAGNNDDYAANHSPGSAALAITVAASHFYDTKPTFSNFESTVDIFAPGVTILSSWYSTNTAYAYLSGTSMATPHISGLALYFIAKEGLASPAAILNRLISASTPNKIVNPTGSPNRLAYNADGY
jgi:oryzin